MLNGHEVVLAGENPRINLCVDGTDGRKVIAQVVPLRLMGNLTFFDYYVPTDVSTQPTTEWALSGRLLEPMDLEPQAEATVIAASDVQSVNLPSVRDSQYLLHRRLAHIGDDMYDATVKCVVNLPKRVAGRPNCPCCSLGKSTVRRTKRNQWVVRAERPAQRFHLDLIGKFRHQSLGGAYYALVIVDDYSRLTEVCTIPSKSSAQVCAAFEEFLAQHCPGLMPESVMTDWGSEFDGAFAKFCVDNKIQMRKSCPYRAYQNGLVERANRSLTRIARTMMIDACMGPEFWGAAIKHAAYILNRVAHRNDMGRTSVVTPYELFYDQVKPDLADLRVFGCAATVHLEDRYMRKELHTAHSRPAIYIGMCDVSDSWRFYIPATRSVVSSDSADFFEDRPGVQVGKTELAPQVPSDQPLPCPSILDTDTAPIDEADANPSSSIVAVMPVAAESSTMAQRRAAATAPAETPQPVVLEGAASPVTAATSSKPSVSFDVPEGGEIVVPTSAADVKAKVSESMSKKDKYVLALLPKSAQALPYMQQRHKKVAGKTLFRH